MSIDHIKGVALTDEWIRKNEAAKKEQKAEAKPAEKKTTKTRAITTGDQSED